VWSFPLSPRGAFFPRSVWHACTCTCTGTCMHACMHMYTCVCACTCYMFIHAHTITRVPRCGKPSLQHTQTHVCTCKYIHVHVLGHGRDITTGTG
jgi:hypothetical protein